MIDLFQILVQAVQDLLSGKADKRQGMIVFGAVLIILVFAAVAAMSVLLLKPGSSF